MGKLFILMGKSASGKDTIYKHLLEDNDLDLKIIVPYTTRPIREGEVEGKEYHFVDETGYENLKADGKILEERVYNTIYGPWRYFTVGDSSYVDSDENYILITTLEAYVNICKKLGDKNVLPIYIELDDGERLFRALARERKQDEPKYTELCRRFIADDEDFSADNLNSAGITNSFKNDDLNGCILQIKEYIAKMI